MGPKPAITLKNAFYQTNPVSHQNQYRKQIHKTTIKRQWRITNQVKPNRAMIPPKRKLIE